MSDKWIVKTHYGDERLTDESSDAPYSVVLPENGSYPEDVVCEVWGTERDDVATAQSICDEHNAFLAVPDTNTYGYLMIHRSGDPLKDKGFTWIKDDPQFGPDWISIPVVPQRTAAATWRTKGEPDPHENYYDCERAALTLGNLTDDELANGAFMNYDRKWTFQELVNPQPGLYRPIVWMTAVKDRIRWLSRALVSATSASSLKVLDDEQVMALVDQMENGQDGFCKQWGFIQFGKKVSAVTLGIKDE
jgi:hypothetical protein